MTMGELRRVEATDAPTGVRGRECRVSVIVPVFNTGSGLIDAIESVTSQTYTNLEVVLVDDGSTDGRTSGLCDQLASSDARLVVVHKENGGVSSARNAGLERATGDYVMFLDADDRLVPGALSAAVSRIVDDGADMACFGMTFVYHEGHHVVDCKVMSSQVPLFLDSKDDLRAHFFDLFDQNYWSSVCNKVYDARFLRETGATFNAELAILEDLHFVLETLKVSPRVTILPEPLYEYMNDVTTLGLNKRPNIDYLRNFELLEQTLEQFADVVGLSSAQEAARVKAMVFRFYLTGVEVLFAQSHSPAERYLRLRAYVRDGRVTAAARQAKPERRGVTAMAWLVKRRLVAPIYLLLTMRRLIAEGRRIMRRAASGASDVVRS